jgi:hypothetical protein
MYLTGFGDNIFLAPNHFCLQLSGRKSKPMGGFVMPLAFQ